ncbi:hypothetical protein IPA_05020 [Ignicoccus pacificus DSM 13166]|uniref:DUF711 family protein n=1 Tax=Ignicoccus pacificus DSM 13166 TaxID=940294 RepID=A0A977PK34_9CREN|nr:hypothetical protein IPA_05020 [Ignicoccus pacificus DSM 13166]
MMFRTEEIAEVTEMLHYLNLDIRAVTLSLEVPSDKDYPEVAASLVEKWGEELVRAVREVVEEHGVPIVTSRIALSPLNVITSDGDIDRMIEYAKEVDEAARRVGVDAVGGFGTFANTGLDEVTKGFLEALPKALSTTERVFGFINVGGTWDGLNIEAIYSISGKLIELAKLTNATGNAKFLVSVNLPGDVPFMPGAHHGLGRPSAEINVAVSGPGVVEAAIRRSNARTFRDLHEEIKKVSFKISRLGEFAGKKVAQKMGIEMGSVDLSLAPTPKMGDSVAKVVEAMGVPSFGAPGTLTALALVIDALKKGGAMAVSRFGGFSGLFIPLSEDAGMLEAAERGTVDIYKLVAYTAICSAGLDMVPIPMVSKETLASLTADQLTIGIVHNKPMGVRLLPVPNSKPGDVIDLGGLLGKGVVLPLEDLSPNSFITREGHMPPPVLRLQLG